MPKEIITWNLAELYKSVDDPRIKDDMKIIRRLAEDFRSDVKGKLREKELTAANLAEYFKIHEEISEATFYLSLFSSLIYSTTSQDDDVKNLHSKIQEFSSNIDEQLIFFELELNEIEDKKFKELLNSKELINYKHQLEYNRKKKDHQLSEKEEQIVLMKDITGQEGFIKLYGEIESGFTYDFEYEGETKTYTTSELFAYMYNQDKEVRKRALKAIVEKYLENELTFVHVYNNVLKDWQLENKRRNYQEPISRRNLSNEISDKAVETLGNVTSDSNKIVEKYYTLKKKIINLEELRMSDIYAPVGEVEKKYTYEEAIELIRIANSEFDESFASIVEEMYKRKHIDVTPRKGKQGGAYCSYGKQKKYPYVFVNFTGNIDSVLTLAHELGHAIHHYNIQQKQTMTNIGSTLPVAEIASVFNEMIAFDYLIKQDLSKEERIILLANHIESNFATSHRQNAFYHFEKRLHELMKTKLPTAQEYKDIHVEEMEKMFGDSVSHIKEDYDSYWSVVSHFIHVPFYVYAYNMSNLLVIALYQKYLEQQKEFVPKFIELLSVGTSQTPAEMLAKMNIDLDDATFWNKGIDYLSTKIDELEELLS
ncbi:MAG: M3 family oligoendopeptidase [Candidatus Heimdallarchaeaceae archaeon]